MIKDNVRFIGYRGFYNRHDIIKDEYSKMLFEDKQIYKYYIYSRRYLREYTCDLIWNYLNDNLDSNEESIEVLLSEECYKYKM